MSVLEELQEQRELLLQSEVGGMTVAELRDMLQQLQHIEQEISLQHANEQSHVRRVKGTDSKAESDADNVPLRKRRLFEDNAGRYIMTILAAGLCLLALGVFITSFWAVVSPMAKLLFISAIGVSLEAVGFYFTRRGHMRPFWLGIAGLGAGVLLLSILAGMLFWQVYGAIVFTELIIVWFVVNYAFAYKQAASVFYAIAYLGSVIAVGLVCSMGINNIFIEMVLVCIAGPATAIGFAGFYKTRRCLLLFVNMIYCWGVSLMSLASVSVALSVTVDMAKFVCYNPTLLHFYILLTSAVCLWFTRYFQAVDGNKRLPFYIAAVCISALFFAAVSHDAFGTVGHAITLLVLCTLYIGSCEGYSLGAAPAAIWALRELSTVVTAAFNSEEVIYSCPALLLCLISLVLCCILPLSKNRYDRVSCVVMLSAAYLSLLGKGFHVNSLLYLVGLTLFCTAIMVYIINAVRYENYFSKYCDSLFFAMSPVLFVLALVSLDVVRGAVACFATTLCLQSYGVFFLPNVPEEERGLPQLLWSIMRVISYVALMFFMAQPDTVTKVFTTLSLIVVTVYNLFQLVSKRTRVQTVVSCILTNWHLFVIASMWSISYQLPISFVGLLLGAIFIIIGFCINFHSVRQCGHLCCIVYSLKMGLFDATAGGVGTAGGLLLAGIVCFGISLIYNRLEKRKATDDLNTKAFSDKI